jgi:hypothetical protein
MAGAITTAQGGIRTSVTVTSAVAAAHSMDVHMTGGLIKEKAT